MSMQVALILVSILLVALLLSGSPVFLGIGVAGIIALFLTLGGAPALDAAGIVSWASANSFILTAVPLFVLFGEFCFHAKFGTDLFDAAAKWIGRLRGGLAASSIFAIAVFSAASGSSTASSLTMGVISIPEMLKWGYDRKLTYGTLAAGGTLDIMIPPSITMIIYGAFTGTSVGTLYLAGFAPGFMMSIMFIIYTLLLGYFKPHLAPAVTTRYSWGERFSSLKGVWAIFFLIVVILGGIYSGVMTPTEAAGVAAFLAIALGIAMRKLDPHGILGALRATARLTSMMMFIVIGALILSNALTALQVTSNLIRFVGSLPVPSWVILIALYIVYILLGSMVDALSMMVMTLPVVAPMMQALGYDLVWFGIIMVLLVQKALITPPGGINLYVIQSLTGGRPISEVFIGVLPYWGILMVALILLTVFPSIALGLPWLAGYTGGR